MKTPETREKEQLDNILKSLPGCWYCCPATFGYGTSGTPDRIAVIAGKFYGFEVKREGKAPTPIQERRMREIRAAGGHAFAGTAEVLIRKIQETL